MNIIGLDELVFGVGDLEACKQYLLDYGLKPSQQAARGERFEALDGTAITVCPADHPDLPPPLRPGALLRETIYGVGDDATLESIATELGKDRAVQRGSDASISCVDDMGFALRFKRTIRGPFAAPPDLTNAPGSLPQRPVNIVGVTPEMPAVPRTLSHVVLFVPDVARAEAFYHRLGFRTTDRFINAGPFMRPAGTEDHHTLFMIQTPPLMQGVEHFTFHNTGYMAAWASEVKGGEREMEDKPIVEGIARIMGAASFWDLKPVLLQIDTAAVLARRILAKKIEAEQGEH